LSGPETSGLSRGCVTAKSRPQLQAQEETTRAIQQRLVGGGIDTPDITASAAN
jgi:hypothetical protein